MPTFPTYRGELPRCLNPLSLRHYFLLAYWIYFRPTALRHYLYQADPDFYRAGPKLVLARAFRNLAYRNLYLMIPGVIAIASMSGGIPLAVLTSSMMGRSTDWFKLIVGILVSIPFGMAMGMMFSLAYGMASGVVSSVALGIAAGLGSSVAFGVALPIAIVETHPALTGNIVSLVIFGIAWGLAIGAAFGVGRFVAGGVMLGIAISAVGGASSGLLGIAANNISVVWGLSAIGFVAAGVVSSIGALRLLFYPLQFIIALMCVTRPGKHPLEWDDLIVLPLPGERSVLLQRLNQNELDGLGFLAQVTSNPFQRWAAQAALQSYLHHRLLPIHFVYNLLIAPDLDSLIPAPASPEDWEALPVVKRLLLGELDRRQVDYGRDWAMYLPDRLVWRYLTWLLCDRRKTPLTRFAGMLYELLDEKAVEADQFDLTAYADIYTGLMDYSGGEEIAHSFERMAACLACDDIASLPEAARVSIPSNGVLIRPVVMEALARLGQVGAEVAAYQDATSRASKLAALARANDTLKELDDYVAAQVMAPEQYILRRIVRQWQRLITKAGGRLGRAGVTGPVANPYVLNNPVQGDLFIGREEVMRRLEELWGGEGQKPSIVIYGHRRMGKSSILHNLGARFGVNTVIVDFNLQRVGMVASTGELLYNLALALYDSLPPTVREKWGEPDEERFTAHNPYTAFDRFLKQLDEARVGRRLIVAVDEFELIERGIAEGRLEARLLDFWRGLIQTWSWFVMAFAGLHTLEEMRRDYWHPLYGSVTAIPVSFLGHDAAWRLITNPTPDFPLDYEAEAVEHIITLTHGQPYLIQLIGHGLVTRFNQQTFEHGAPRERRFTLADVEAVINAPEFYRDGDAYFTGVWVQAEKSEPPGQTTVLRALASSAAGLSVEVIASQTNLAPENVRRALDTLVHHDVVTQENGRWKFTVELMRRWVAQREADVVVK